MIALFVGAPARGEMRDYQTKYYVIHTDIDPDQVKEAAIRMTKMAEEYHERTQGFAGVISAKLPFYLFRSAADYYSAGGMPGSAGVFKVDESGSRLMAIAGRKTMTNTWHIVQHEGFHQFAYAVIGGDIPTWLNEGLAEYFGESIFTGDGFVTGVVPPWRLARLKQEIQDGQMSAVRHIMHVSPREWAAELSVCNYDQAWSMVHFLVNADDGKYRPAFSSCIRGISEGKPFDRAWLLSIGSADGFEDRWKNYWLAQPRSPTAELYARASIATLTSFLARATAQNQTFADYVAFQTAADADQIQISSDDWLPNSLLSSALRSMSPDLQPVLHRGQISKLPVLTVALSDGTRLTGWFTLNGARVDQVSVETDDLPKALKVAAQMLADGSKSSDARQLVQNSLRQHPMSVAAPEAKRFLMSLR